MFSPTDTFTCATAGAPGSASPAEVNSSGAFSVTAAQWSPELDPEQIERRLGAAEVDVAVSAGSGLIGNEGVRTAGGDALGIVRADPLGEMGVGRFHALVFGGRTGRAIPRRR